jgi:hypothetical protein
MKVGKVVKMCVVGGRRPNLEAKRKPMGSKQTIQDNCNWREGRKESHEDHERIIMPHDRTWMPDCIGTTPVVVPRNAIPIGVTRRGNILTGGKFSLKSTSLPPSDHQPRPPPRPPAPPCGKRLTLVSNRSTLVSTEPTAKRMASSSVRLIPLRITCMESTA